MSILIRCMACCVRLSVRLSLFPPALPRSRFSSFVCGRRLMLTANDFLSRSSATSSINRRGECGLHFNIKLVNSFVMHSMFEIGCALQFNSKNVLCLWMRPECICELLCCGRCWQCVAWCSTMAATLSINTQPDTGTRTQSSSLNAVNSFKRIEEDSLCALNLLPSSSSSWAKTPPHWRPGRAQVYIWTFVLLLPIMFAVA